MGVCLRFFFLVNLSILMVSSQETVILNGSSNQKMLSSPRNVFELGFFQPNLTVGRWYLGIWYREDPTKTSVWLANRDRPLTGPNGTLRVSNNDLVLFDQDDSRAWSANLSGPGVSVRAGMVTELLDNGNLVVKEAGSDEYLWQSFDHPTDTLLPQMKLGFLTSWSGPDDPSTEWSYSFEIRTTDMMYTIYITDKLINREYGGDIWNGYRFGDMPPAFQFDEKTGYFSLKASYSRLTLAPSGSYGLFVWNPKDNLWKQSWSKGLDPCYWEGINEPCGTNSYCSRNTTASSCNCLEGFHQKHGPSFGCVRMTPLNCAGDMFRKLPHMKLPADWEYQSHSVQECEELCLKHCDCTAFAVVESRKGHLKCLWWKGELKYMQNYTVGGQDVYVRVAEKSANKSAPLEPWAIGLIVGGVLLFIFCFCFGLGIYYWKRMQREAAATQGPSDTELMINEMREDRFTPMELGTIVEATDNFSEANILGRGGFGIVYKGILPNGAQVAVKRLSERSSTLKGPRREDPCV